MGIWSYKVFSATCDRCDQEFEYEEELTSDSEIETALEERGWTLVVGLRETGCVCPRCKCN